ncbi:765_t:CDS:2 [Dentiscutata heterogama]|uniref:765_t:CDS:1 n=1 Tax=Dentiscutata heterogama TaxID=1316150 RepID=A0ACA9K379_9GLOM|nr:765_t:CDS:2 [Dentiscutata heterogama]
MTKHDERKSTTKSIFKIFSSADESSQVNNEISQLNDEPSQLTPQLNNEISQSNEETSQSNGEASQSNEEASQSNEEASQLNEETSQSNEETSQSNEETSQSNENTSLSNEETSESNEETSQLDEETSKIITNEHIKEIISWISPLPYDSKHELKLILRGSRDGFEKTTFYNKCKIMDNTIIILKVLETGEIFGGYNPLTWKVIKGKKYKETGSSFIFSLKTNEQSNSTLSRVKNKDFAICCLKGFGPSFGFLDLFVSKNDLKTWGCNQSNYEKAIKRESQFREFQIEDYEVFRYERII